MKSVFKLTVLATASLAAASPAAAQESDAAPKARGLVLAPASEWRLREYDDKCRISRTFGSGEDRVTLWLDQGGALPIFNLTLIGRPFRHPYGGGVILRLGDEPEIPRNYISAKSSKGRPVLSMFGLTLAQGELERGEDADAPDIVLGEQRAGAIDRLRIRNAIVEPVQLELGEMTAPFAFLQECGTRIEGLLSAAGRALTKEARPPEPIDDSDWLIPTDYPPYLVRSEMQATLTYRLTVAKSGKVTGCFITSSNKPQLFDDATCLGLMRRAKFKPALDGKGEPVASYYIGKVTFRIT